MGTIVRDVEMDVHEIGRVTAVCRGTEDGVEDFRLALVVILIVMPEKRVCRAEDKRGVIEMLRLLDMEVQRVYRVTSAACGLEAVVDEEISGYVGRNKAQFMSLTVPQVLGVLDVRTR